MSPLTAAVLALIDERTKQDERFGEQNHPDGTGGYNEPELHGALARAVAWAQEDYADAKADGSLTWRHVLDEEVKEAFAESDPVLLRQELLQVAAVAVAWVEAIDRRGAS